MECFCLFCIHTQAELKLLTIAISQTVVFPVATGWMTAECVFALHTPSPEVCCGC